MSSTGRVDSLLRAGARGKQAPWLLRADNARQNVFTDGRNRVRVSTKPTIGGWPAYVSNVKDAISCQMPRRSAALVPKPFSWDGEFLVCGQMSLHLGELWDAHFTHSAGDNQSVFTIDGLPPLDLSQAYACEIKTARFASAHQGGSLFVDNSQPYGVDLSPSGQVVLARVTSHGKNYTSDPTVTITGDGTGATATASRNTTRKQVTTITITNGGSGYNPETTQIIISGGGGEGAEAQASVRPLGGIDYFNDGSLFWEPSLVGIEAFWAGGYYTRPPVHLLFLARPGTNEEPTNGLSDITIAEVPDLDNSDYAGAMFGEEVLLTGYTPGAGWTYNLDHWVAEVKPAYSLSTGSFLRQLAPKQVIRVDPLTRQSTDRWWLPEPGEGSAITLHMGVLGDWPEWGSSPLYPATHPYGEHEGELLSNPAIGIGLVGLVWPECRGNAFFLRYTNYSDTTRKIFWRVADPLKVTGRYTENLSNKNVSPRFNWVAPMRPLLEAPSGSTPPGWNLLCNIPASTEQGDSVPFITQPAVGQLVVLSTDIDTLNDGDTVQGLIFPLGTRLPFMLRGKEGMVGGWDGLTPV